MFWTARKEVRKNCNKTVVNRVAGNGLIFASPCTVRADRFPAELLEKYRRYRGARFAASIASREPLTTVELYFSNVRVNEVPIMESLLCTTRR